MDLPSTLFGPYTLAMMGHVCDEAWHEIKARHSFPSAWGEKEIRSQLARRVMAAVASGEYDPERLKACALHSLDG
jgi:hypothetical protein